MYFHRRCLRTSDAPKPFPGPHAKDWIHGTKYLAIMRAAIEQEYLARRMPSNLAVAFVHEIMEINPAKKSHVRAQLEKRRSNCEKKAQAALDIKIMNLMSHVLKLPLLNDTVQGIYVGRQKFITFDSPVDEAHDAGGAAAAAALRREVFCESYTSGPVSSICFSLNSSVTAEDADHEMTREDLLRERGLLLHQSSEHLRIDNIQDAERMPTDEDFTGNQEDLTGGSASIVK